VTVYLLTTLQLVRLDGAVPTARQLYGNCCDLRNSFSPVEFNGQKFSKLRCFVQRCLIREHFV